MASAPESRAFLPTLYYAYPAVVFVYFLASALVSVCTLQRLEDGQNASPEWLRRRHHLRLLGLFIFIHVVQLVAVIACAASSSSWPPEDHLVVGSLLCLLIFGIQLSWLSDLQNSLGYPLHGSWFLALLFEVAIGACIAAAVFGSGNGPATLDIILLSLGAARLVTVLALVACPFITHQAKPRVGSDEEHQSLLPKHGGAAQAQTADASGYGAATDSDQSLGEAAEFSWERREREAREAMEKRLKEGGNWLEYTKGFMVRCTPLNPRWP